MSVTASPPPGANTAVAAVQAPPLHTQRYPLALAYLCGAFVLGVYLASSSIAPWIPSVVALTLVAVVCRRAGWQAGAMALLCVPALVLGDWRATATAYRDSVGQVGHYTGQRATIIGVIDGEPRAGGRGENLPIQVELLQSNAHSTAVRGRILAHYTGPVPVEYGDRLQLTGQLSVPYSTPGFDYRAYLAGQGIHAVMDFPSLRLLARGNGNPLEAIALRVRDALRRTIAAMLPHDEAALLIGILLGAPTRSLGALTEPFVAVGMIHVVAISGLKVALVAGMISAGCRWLPMRWRWAPAFSSVLLYTLVSGATPSGLRAALMWALALLALQTGRQSYVWVSLAVVAAGMVCWNPLLLWDTGFQLSVVGTAGIVLFTEWFERPLHRLPPLLREATAVTLAAQVATLPITAIGFGQVSLAGPVANGLLLPLLGPIIALGGVAATIATLAPPLAHVLGYLVYPLLALFIAAVRWLAALPFATLAWPVVPLALIGPYYLLLLALARLRVGHAATILRPVHGPLALVRSGPPTLVIGAGLAALTCSAWVARPAAHPVLWVAGAGSGQALLLQTPRNQALLIDGGDTPSAVQALLGSHLPFWQRDLAAALVSEPDLAHLGGLLGLSGLYRVGRAYDPGAIYPSITYAHWRAELRNDGVPEAKVRTGRRLDLGAGVYIDVLLPVALALDEVPAPVAFRVRLGRLAVLVVNRESLADDPAPLRADGACLDVLVLPLRADPSAAASLVRALQPHLVVLPPISMRANQRSLRVADLSPLPASTRVWQTAASKELMLTGADGHCGP